MWILTWVAKPAVGGAGFLLLVFLIYPFIGFFQYLDYCSYKDEVEILNTECYGFVWNDEINNYKNGAEYVEFAIDVKFGDEPVDLFKVDTLVYNSDGNFIGYLYVTFYASDFPMKTEITEDGLLCFERNSTIKFYFSSHHITGEPWDETETITSLYRAWLNNELDEFTFVTNAVHIGFCYATSVGPYNNYYYDENGNMCLKEDY